MKKLTEKQKRFVDEYLIDLNATQAYIRAGYQVKNENTAAVMATRLLRNDNIQVHIQKRQEAIQKRTEVTQDMVIAELAKIAFSNGSDFAKVVTKPKLRKVWDNETQEYVDEEVEEQFVELLDTETLPDDKKAAIAEISEGKFGISVKSCDKVKALELIGKHLGIFKEKIEMSGQVNNPMEGLTTEDLKKLINDG